MVKTGGPIRGFFGRWIMRFEAAGQIISMVAQVTTALSALSGVLAYSGYAGYVPVVLLSGGLGGIAFVYGYTEWGIYNRKNREKQLRGKNYSKPQNAIDDAIIARTIIAAEKERTLTDEERQVIEQESIQGYQDYHNGIDLRN